MFVIKKPFSSIKCRTCRSKEFANLQSLCPKCELYVNQDYVRQQESPYWFFDDFSYTYEADIKSNKKALPTFKTILRKVKLTRQQRKIIRLIFEQNLPLTKISFILGISDSSVRKQRDRALFKLKNCRGISLLVREENKISKPRSSKSEEAKLKQFKTEIKDIDPYLYYSKCPKCEDTDLTGKKNQGICQGCGWSFSVHSVEDVQNSHPWPDNPILDGSDY